MKNARRVLPSTSIASAATSIERLSFCPERIALRNSFWTLSTWSTPTTSISPSRSRTPNTIVPPPALAKADAVSYADFGTAARASLNSASRPLGPFQPVDKGFAIHPLCFPLIMIPPLLGQ